MTRPAPSPNDVITFHASHRPALDAGDYTLTVTLEPTGKSNEDLIATRDVFEKKVQFTVAGERFRLRKADLRSCYPPPDAHGNFNGVLPHLVLNRSTLPWERSPFQTDKRDHPTWLALLVFRADEAPPITVIKAKDVVPSGQLESTQDPEEAVCCIDIDAATLRALAPLRTDLPLLAHARTIHHAPPVSDAEVAGDDAGEALDGGDESEVNFDAGTTEVGVILGTRVIHADAGQTSSWVVHVVSLEGAYDVGQDEHAGVRSGQATTRLATLFHWGFTCDSDGTHFLDLCKSLDGVTEATRANAFRLPVERSLDAAAELLDAGSIPLVHRLRNGGRTVTWYRGPLVPVLPEKQSLVDVVVPARGADDLLLFDHETGMFDASYAVAWELGRLSALADHGFATGLARWKRARGRRSVQARMDVESDTLARLGHARHSSHHDLPDALADFIDQLTGLATLPPSHLVPDLRVLPQESLRFVDVDPTWVRCLLDGAMSIGRVTRADHAHDRLQHAQRPQGNPVSGFLLRSKLVSLFPTLEVHGVSCPTESKLLDAETGGTPRSVILSRKLAPDIWLVLFDADGPLDLIELGLPPEVLHFGVDLEKLPKTVWRDEPTRILNLDGLAKQGAEQPLADGGALARRHVQSAPLFRVFRKLEVIHG